ncbi:MAG: helix-turn-helix transcriptional regulator [Nocardioides sp.]
MNVSPDYLADLRVQVKTIDAGLLGRRIRRARQRAGMTQGGAAGTEMSTAYISRIEGGQRRPSADLLMVLAERLRCDPEELLAPDDSVVTHDAAVVARLALELDYAELELRTGAAAASLSRVEAVLAEAVQTTAIPQDLAHQARLLRAMALEAVGRPAEATDTLEHIVESDQDPLRLIRAFTALSRCYRECSDYARAADVGDRAIRLIDQRDLEGTAEGLKLAVTVAAAHFERGDTHHAVRVCQRALVCAESLGSPEARAAAYWNTAIMESRQGRIGAALPLASKALALLEAVEDSRSQTRLRVQLGLLHLRSEPPHAQEALALLSQADQDGQHSDINAADRARIKVGTARALFMVGNLADAERAARVALEESSGVSVLLESEALLLHGEIASARDEGEVAVTHLRMAASRLTTLGSEHTVDHGVAQLWFELGALLDHHGLFRESALAYRSAGSTTGLRRAPAATPATT